MIKLIIFDLDGVLISSKDLHFTALNEALRDKGYDPISIEDHVSVFDGNPTSWKLKRLGIPSSDFDAVNQLKQQHTFRLLETLLEREDRFVDLFTRLKKEGYKICVASNSIRYTTTLSLFRLGVMEYVDYVCSNQDVSLGKPNPEMYLQCMIKCGVGPRETLIVEDSYVGRQGVFNSGAYLCGVHNPSETTYELIRSKINRYDEVKTCGEVRR